jgi:hypothetical protein
VKCCHFNSATGVLLVSKVRIVFRSIAGFTVQAVAYFLVDLKRKVYLDFVK